MALIMKLLPKNRFLRKKRHQMITSKPTTGSSIKDVELGEDVVRNLELTFLLKAQPTVTLLIGEPSEVLQVNRTLLTEASPRFLQILESQPGLNTVRIDNVRTCIFRKILDFIHNVAPWQFDGNFAEAFELLKTADYFGLVGLVEEIRVQFGKLPLEENACKLFDAFRTLGEETAGLAKAALAYIENNTHKLITSDAFLHLSVDSLCEILASDRLTVPGEVELFFAVMRWGQFACSKTFKNVPREHLRELLSRPLQLIRFPRMSAEDLDDFVIPSKLLTEEQVTEIGKIWAEEMSGGGNEITGGFNASPRNYYAENGSKSDLESSVESFLSDELPLNLQKQSSRDEDPSLVEMLSTYKHHVAHLAGTLEKTQEELSETRSSLVETKDLTFRLQEQTTKEMDEMRSKLTETMKELHQTKLDLMETTQVLATTMQRLESTWKILHRKSSMYEATKHELDRVVGDLNVTKTILRKSIVSQEHTKNILAGQIAHLEETFTEDLKDTREALHTQISSSIANSKDIDTLKSRVQETNQHLDEAIMMMKISSAAHETSRRILTSHDVRLQQVMTEIHGAKDELLFQMGVNRDQALALRESREDLRKFKTESSKELRTTKEEMAVAKNVLDQKINFVEERQEVMTRDFEFKSVNMTLIEEVLRLLIAHPVPIGFLYTQFGAQIPPQELWPTCKWEDVTKEYAGLFFRVCHGDSRYDQTKGQVLPSAPVIPFCRNQESMAVVRIPQFPHSHNQGVSKASSIQVDQPKGLQIQLNGIQMRPRNQVVRIWRRF